MIQHAGHLVSTKFLIPLAGLGVLLTDVTNPIVAVCGAILAVAAVIALFIRWMRWLGERTANEKRIGQMLEEHFGKDGVMNRLDRHADALRHLQRTVDQLVKDLRGGRP